jgi:hypothetical protein
MKSPAAATLGSTPPCWICNKPVSLEKGQQDEHGNIVHAECHAIRLKLEKAGSLGQKKPE